MIRSYCAIIPGLDLFVVIGKKRVQFFVKNLWITRQVLAYICTLAIIIHSKIDFRVVLFTGQVDAKINHNICPPITFL